MAYVRCARDVSVSRAVLRRGDPAGHLEFMRRRMARYDPRVALEQRLGWVILTQKSPSDHAATLRYSQRFEVFIPLLAREQGLMGTKCRKNLHT